jgi:DNA polymerase III alpha subunit
MSSLKEIEERQQRMYQLIDKMVAEEDMTIMLQTVQLIEAEARALEAAAMAFQAKMTKESGKPATGGFEVVLTPEQRARILKATGVNMETVFVEDLTGSLNVTMPQTHPAQIEAIALKQAWTKAYDKMAADAGRAQVERQLMELEAQNELVAAEVAKLRQDPRFREAIGLDPKKP